MGSSSSKPARKLAKEAASSSSAAAKTTLRASEVGSRPAYVATSQTDKGGSPPPRTTTTTAHISTVLASESKTKDVQRDGQDPQLLANLQKLGAVNVQRGKMQYQRSNPMLNILSARSHDAEQERLAKEERDDINVKSNASTAMRNRLGVGSIVALLDGRKECKTQADLDDLARAFDVDQDVIRQLAAFVNSPSVDVNARLRQRQQGTPVEEGETPMERIDAIWTDPALEDGAGEPKKLS